MQVLAEPFCVNDPDHGLRTCELRVHLHGARRVWYTPEYIAACIRGRKGVARPRYASHRWIVQAPHRVRYLRKKHPQRPPYTTSVGAFLS